MKITTPALYLLGNRKAIADIAHDRVALWLGAFFVLTAGLARNYDQVLLTQQPHHLLTPFMASLVSSFFIFWFTGIKKYAMFLRLFWMTAPIAWIYGIPVERMGLGSYQAAFVNMCFLGVVSVWRVVLIIWVVRVLTGFSLLESATRVLFPVSVIVGVISFFTSLSIAVGKGMAGLAYSPEEEIILAVVNVASFCSFVVFLLTLGGLLFIKIAKEGKIFSPLSFSREKNVITTKFPFVSALAILGFWLVVTGWAQPKIKLNKELKKWWESAVFEYLYQLNENGNITSKELQEQARKILDKMSSYQANDFSYVHRIAPYPGAYSNIFYQERYLSVMAWIIFALEEKDPKWLKKFYFDNLKSYITHSYKEYHRHDEIKNLDSTFALLEKALHKTEYGREWLAKNKASLYQFGKETGNLKESLEQLLKSSDKSSSPPEKQESK